MEAYITKGTRVHVERLHVTGPAALAGAQMKFGAELHSFEGTVRHVRGDDPVNPTKIGLWVEPDEGAEKYDGKMCPKCGVLEVGPIALENIRPIA